MIDFSQQDSLISPKGTLVVKDFEINDFEQGDLSLNVEGENSYEKYKVALFLDTEEARSISATGDLDFSKSIPLIDLDISMLDFQIDVGTQEITLSWNINEFGFSSFNFVTFQLSINI